MLLFRTPIALTLLAAAAALGACTPRVSVTRSDAATDAATTLERARASTPLPAPAEALERELRALTAGFQGDVGIYVRHLASGQVVAIAADDTFPTASMVKLPLLVALYQRIEDRALHPDSAYALTDSTVLQSDGEDIVAQLKWGGRCTCESSRS